MIKALIIAEHHDGVLSAATRATMNAASQLSASAHVLIAGVDLKPVVEQVQRLAGVAEVIVAEHAAYEHALAENMATLASQLAKDYQYVLTNATTFGKNILPYMAGLLDVDMVSDVIKIIDGNTFIRPIYAGNAQETVQLDEKIMCLTVRSTAFEGIRESNTIAPIKLCDIVCDLKRSHFKSLTQDKKNRPDLTQARIVVSGGRALGSKENFKLIEELADALGGAVGATRAAVDAGYIANEYQVGQTGKMVAPELYIALGISGAIQHLAGMKDSKIIVAINKDKDAPIFQIADYGLVGDLFELVPQLTNQIRK
jgi:electron transfer flavoprotein alpha subunit